jgi:hypothetical protein
VKDIRSRIDTNCLDIQAAERVREAEIEQLAGLKVTRVDAKNEFDRANEARNALKRRKDDFQAELDRYTVSFERYEPFAIDLMQRSHTGRNR